MTHGQDLDTLTHPASVKALAALRDELSAEISEMIAVRRFAKLERSAPQR